ncbi:9776_t:CDS:2 [Entrophospora sp. SA101]|nr:9776_t:CDS:2 [Entrophospora sp. SA101]
MPKTPIIIDITRIIRKSNQPEAIGSWLEIEIPEDSKKSRPIDKKNYPIPNNDVVLQACGDFIQETSTGAEGSLPATYGLPFDEWPRKIRKQILEAFNNSVF